MRRIIAGLQFTGFVVLGIYVGFWQMFVLGIVQFIQQIRAPEIDTFVLAMGIVKILSSGFVGFTIIFIGVLVGNVILLDSKYDVDEV